MLPYFLVTIPIAVMATVTPMHRRVSLLWALAFMVIVIFVGLRHHVGMDWNNYLIMIQRANVGDIWESLYIVEPGYAILLWISGQQGLGIYGAYFVGTLIFAAGLFRYASTTPAPWIALLVAMPYLVIVVAMAAARQTVAIGILLWLAAEWSNASVRKRVFLILLAACFHFSAISFLAFVFLDLRMPTWVKTIGLVLMAFASLYVLEATGRADYYDALYVTGQTELTQSSGAILHVMLNAAPVLMCLLLGRRARSLLIPDSFHRHLAILAIFLVPMALVTSVAAGRMTLYLFPVSMFIFSSIPLLFRNSALKSSAKALIACLFVGILAIWLNYANSSGAHQNYRNALFLTHDELVLCCK